MQKIKHILKHFSFSDHEINIYLAALALGQTSVSDIAKKVDMNRTAAYFHIKNLLKKGVLKETRHGKTKRFIATDPNDLANNLETLLEDFRGFLPELESLQTIEAHAPIIEMTDTDRNYFKVYQEIMRMPEGSTFRIIEGKRATIQELSMLTPEQWFTFFEKTEKRKIITKGIFTKEALGVPKKILSKKNIKIFRNRIWKIRTMSEDILPLKHLTMIYGNKVSLLFPDGHFVVTITHQGVADIMTAMFEALYHFGTDVKKPWG